MRWTFATAAAVIALAAGTALGQPGDAIGDRPDCVHARGQAVNTGYGYRHSVHVENRCSFAVDCRVFTDVNPEVQRIHLEAGGTTDVPTFLSSPASTFVSTVECPTPRGRTPTITDPGE
jgi:hypothetical protein